ncbi:MAG: hypothetical protein AAFW68_03925 [Pseudomonadota bacterium]
MSVRPKSVLVIGAGAALGLAIVKHLRTEQVEAIGTYRTLRAGVSAKIEAVGARAEQLDLEDKDRTQALLAEVDAAIMTPILSASAPAASFLGAGQRAVFFSSNNVALDPQAEVYEKLLESERHLTKSTPQAVILRPTMIYGYPGDGNMSCLMTFMQRWPVTPSPGDGAALQQPVFFDDLAQIAVRVLLSENQQNGIYAVAGPAPIPLRELYRQAAAAIGSKTLTVPAPARLAGKGLQALESVGLRFPVNAAQLLRATRDKTPIGENTIFGETSLERGLSELAAAMTAAEPQNPPSD